VLQIKSFVVLPDDVDWQLMIGDDDYNGWPGEGDRNRATLRDSGNFIYLWLKKFPPNNCHSYPLNLIPIKSYHHLSKSSEKVLAYVIWDILWF
jgi:hypothetical protein